MGSHYRLLIQTEATIATDRARGSITDWSLACFHSHCRPLEQSGVVGLTWQYHGAPIQGLTIKMLVPGGNRFAHTAVLKLVQQLGGSDTPCRVTGRVEKQPILNQEELETWLTERS